MKAQKHSFRSNVAFHFRQVWIWNKSMFLYSVIFVAAGMLGTYLGVRLPALLVELLERKASIQEMAVKMIFLICCIILANFVWQYANAELDFGRMFYDKYYMMLLNRKMMDVDYELLENEENQPAIHSAFRSFCQGMDGVDGALLMIPRFLQDLLGFLVFGTSVALVDVRVMLLMILGCTASVFANMRGVKYMESRQEELGRYHKKLNYILHTAGDFRCGKDIRMYRMARWFQEVFKELTDREMRVSQKISNRWFLCDAVSAVAALVLTLAIYGFFVLRVLSGRISVSDFVFYVGLATGMQYSLQGLISEFMVLQRENEAFRNLRSCLDLENRTNRGSGAERKKESAGSVPPCIVCEDVDFSYPGTDRRVIKNFDLTIKSGERLGIVGSNGAGKTTLVKLICGLYDCSAGSIRLDGTKVHAFNRIEYFKLFSAVFQDVEVLPATIARNVAMCSEEETDYGKVWSCLEKAGLSEKVKKLPQGLETCLVKSIYENAIDLSGGEKQKLVLARALYKDAPVLILDEPTAALDPIAEDEIYRKYNEVTAHKTALFISHRLASTRFCDRIIYMEDGKIAEMGTHEELMAQRGKYWNMFEIQSQYYREEAGTDGTAE